MKCKRARQRKLLCADLSVQWPDLGEPAQRRPRYRGWRFSPVVQRHRRTSPFTHASIPPSRSGKAWRPCVERARSRLDCFIAFTFFSRHRDTRYRGHRTAFGYLLIINTKTFKLGLARTSINARPCDPPPASASCFCAGAERCFTIRQLRRALPLAIQLHPPIEADSCTST